MVFFLRFFKLLQMLQAEYSLRQKPPYLLSGKLDVITVHHVSGKEKFQGILFFFK
jgi:hypothetical protein